jgi:proteic killer suppression protein
LQKQLVFRKALLYILAMIKTFRHKGLKTLYLTGNAKGVRADHVSRLRRVLSALDIAAVPDDMDEPGMRLHLLKGELAGFWSVSVSGNWRVIFRFVGADVELVDYLDYH